MGRALDQARAVIEKLIGQPLQCDATMGALILVDENLPGTSHGQQRNSGNLEASALSFWNVAGLAQKFQPGLLRLMRKCA